MSLIGMGMRLGLLENADCRCPKNVIDHSLFFGLIKWKTLGYHRIELISIKEWAFGKWEAHGKCQDCGSEFRPFGITDAALVRDGLPLDEIKANPRWWSKAESDAGEYKKKETADAEG